VWPDTAADDGQCTLREAITAAHTDNASGAMPGECGAGSGDDTINFQAGLTGEITLGSELGVSTSMAINGPGASHLTNQRDKTYSFDYQGKCESERTLFPDSSAE
jgi:CSLREA domain-containing protein